MALECVGLKHLILSRDDCLESWDPQLPGTARALQDRAGIGLPLPFSILS